MKRILFIGCVESSKRLLEKLLQDKRTIVGVVTKRQSEFNADFFDLRILSEKNNIPCFYTNNINDRECRDFMFSLCPDIAFCFGWSQLLREETIRLFPEGVVGFHPAELPHNRGRHPIVWALALGLSETASSFFMINAKADEGDIISQRRISIAYEDDARTLYDKIMDVAVKQESEVVDMFENDSVIRVKQCVNEGNVWRKRTKDDGRIDWRMSSRCIYNLIRALTKPYVGAHFMYAGNEYKVWRAQEIDMIKCNNIEPGKVLAVSDGGTMDIKTGDGVIRLLDFDAIRIREGSYVL